MRTKIERDKSTASRVTLLIDHPPAEDFEEPLLVRVRPWKAPVKLNQVNPGLRDTDSTAGAQAAKRHADRIIGGNDSVWSFRQARQFHRHPHRSGKSNGKWGGWCDNLLNLLC